jgi:hypothetical protein
MEWRHFVATLSFSLCLGIFILLFEFSEFSDPLFIVPKNSLDEEREIYRIRFESHCVVFSFFECLRSFFPENSFKSLNDVKWRSQREREYHYSSQNVIKYYYKNDLIFFLHSDICTWRYMILLSIRKTCLFCV